MPYIARQLLELAAAASRTNPDTLKKIKTRHPAQAQSIRFVDMLSTIVTFCSSPEVRRPAGRPPRLLLRPRRKLVAETKCQPRPHGLRSFLMLGEAGGSRR